LLAVAATAVAAAVAIGLVVGFGGAPARPKPRPADNGAAWLAHPQLAQMYLAAATSDVVAVASYDYRHLDDALATGLAVSGGRYRASYQAALSGQQAARIRAAHVVHEFAVQRAAIGAMTAGGAQARVLIFGTDAVRSDATAGRTQTTPVVLTATMSRRGVQYLITDLASNADPGLPPGTAGLSAVVHAARVDVARRVGPVQAAGVEHASGSEAVLLVAADRNGRQLRYEITMVLRRGTWGLARADLLGIE
jgi:hypothetical protein